MQQLQTSLSALQITQRHKLFLPLDQQNIKATPLLAHLANLVKELEDQAKALQEQIFSFHLRQRSFSTRDLAPISCSLSSIEASITQLKTQIPCVDPISAADAVLKTIQLLEDRRKLLLLEKNELQELVLSPEYTQALDLQKSTFEKAKVFHTQSVATKALTVLILDTQKQIVEQRQKLPLSLSLHLIGQIKKVHRTCIELLKVLTKKYPQPADIMALFTPRELPAKSAAQTVSAQQIEAYLHLLKSPADGSVITSWLARLIAAWPRQARVDERLTPFEKALTYFFYDIEVRLNELSNHGAIARFDLDSFEQEGLLYRQAINQLDRELKEFCLDPATCSLLEQTRGLEWFFDAIHRRIDLFFAYASVEQQKIFSIQKLVFSSLPNATEPQELPPLIRALNELAALPKTPLKHPVVKALETIVARLAKTHFELAAPANKTIFQTIATRSPLQPLASPDLLPLRALPVPVEGFIIHEIFHWLYCSDQKFHPKLDLALLNLENLSEYKELFQQSVRNSKNELFKVLYTRYTVLRVLESYPPGLLRALSIGFHKLTRQVAYQKLQYSTILDYAYFTFWIQTYAETLGPQEANVKELLDEIQQQLVKLQDKHKFPSQLSHEKYEENSDLLLLRIPTDILLPQFFATLSRALYGSGPQQLTAVERLKTFFASFPAIHDTWKSYPDFVHLKPLVSELLIKGILTTDRRPTHFETVALIHTLKLYLSEPDQFTNTHSVHSMEHQLFLHCHNLELQPLMHYMRGTSGYHIWIKGMQLYTSFLKQPLESTLTELKQLTEYPALDVRYEKILKAIFTHMNTKWTKLNFKK